jgi:peptide/nickel transport system permease protein
MQSVWRELAARCAEAAASLAILVTLTFFMAHAIPGGPGYAIMGLKAQPAAVDAVNLQLGLDTPLWWQYATWWRHLAQGSLGTSYLLNQPVAALLADYAGRTVPLQALGLGMGLMLALTAGCLHGAFYRAWQGRLLGGMALVLYATPGFVIGSVLVLCTEGWLPPGGFADLHRAVPTLGDRLIHLILPALTIGLMTYAALAGFVAESVHAELGKPYARTAAAKGLAPAAILLRHALPNALRPLVTLLGLALPSLFAGSMVIESLFAYPGLGWLLWRSAISHDYPILVGGVLVLGMATIIGNLAAEAINAALDPRLRLAA